MSFLKNLGKQKSHFDYSIHVTLAKDVPVAGEGLMCQLRRKDKNIHTKVSVVADDGTIVFNERIDFRGALFANKKGIYDSKIYSIALSTPQGVEHWKAELDLATVVQHESQKETAQTLTLSGKGGSPQLRLVIYACHESVPADRRTYVSGRQASLDEEKGEDSRTSFASASTPVSAAPSSAIDAANSGVGVAGRDRQRKISVMFGKVVSGQVGDDGRRADFDSDVEEGDEELEEDDEESQPPQSKQLSPEESAQVASFRRDRNRFASVDATNMVKTKNNSDFDAATSAMAQFAIAEEGEDQEDDTVAGAQAAYTKQTRDRGFERFFQ